MTLAFYGKSRRRRGVLALAAAVVLLLAIGAGVFGLRQDAGAAPQAQFAVYTSIENVTSASTCPTGGGNGVNCNIYTAKEQVYLNGGPASSFLPDGYYCFSVYSPNQGTLLSSDAPSDRTFQVVNNPPNDPITYLGSTHDLGADTRDATTSTTTIQFMPYADTPNPGGTYKYTLYQYSSLPTHPSGTECNTADAVVEKTDNFKVASTLATIWIKKVTVNDPGGAQPRFSADITRLGAPDVVEADDVAFDVSQPASQIVVVDIDKGAGSDTFRVDENTPPANWAVTGKKVLNGANANCNGTEPWVATSPGSASGGGLSGMKDGDAVTVCFRNEFTAPGTSSIEIHKDDSQASDSPGATPNPVAGATFKLEGPNSAVICVTDDSTANASNAIDPDATAACAGAALRDDENDTGAVTLVSDLAAGAWTITEVARPDGYGPDVCGGTRFVQLGEEQAAVINGPGCEVTNPGMTAFHNPPISEGGTIWNVKVVVNDPADAAVFTADVTGPTPNSDVAFAQGSPHSYSASAGSGYDSVEDDPGPAYNYVGTQVGTFDGVPICPSSSVIDLAVLNQTEGYTLEPGGDLVFCHYNVALGTVVVEKLNLSSLTGPFFVDVLADASVDATLEVPDGGDDSVTRPVGSAIYSIGGESLSNQDEVFFGPDICLREPEGSYFTVALLSANATLDFAGDEVRFQVTNQDCAVLATGNLRIEKWNDLNGNGIRDVGEPAVANWPVTVSGPEFPGGQAFVTNASGVVPGLDGITTGFYTVAEGAQGGWYQTGLIVDGANKPVSATTVVEVAEATEEEPLETVVEFGNRQLARIIVIKTVNDQVGIPPRGVGSWHINVAGCGTSINKLTDGTGTAVFDNLQPADNCAYTVTETDTEGFTVTYSPGQVVAPGPGGTATVNVHNSRTVTITVETPTPTSTPVTPTATPTETPTEPPPTETVAGERTPGPGAIATPIAPEAGTGFRSGGTAGSIGLALLGLAAVTGGMLLLSLGRKRA